MNVFRSSVALRLPIIVVLIGLLALLTTMAMADQSAFPQAELTSSFSDMEDGDDIDPFVVSDSWIDIRAVPIARIPARLLRHGPTYLININATGPPAG